MKKYTISAKATDNLDKWYIVDAKDAEIETLGLMMAGGGNK